MPRAWIPEKAPNSKTKGGKKSNGKKVPGNKRGKSK